jgi:hypothetical protein
MPIVMAIETPLTMPEYWFSGASLIANNSGYIDSYCHAHNNDYKTPMFMPIIMAL